MPVDPRALGFESEDALLGALRARFGIPDELSISVYLEIADGVRVLTMLVTGRAGAHAARDDKPE